MKKNVFEEMDMRIEQTKTLLQKGICIICYHPGGLLSLPEDIPCMVIHTDIEKPFAGRENGIELIDAHGRVFTKSYFELAWPEKRFRIASDDEKIALQTSLKQRTSVKFMLATLQEELGSL